MRKPHTEETVLALIDKTENCWLWLGCINNRGYGRVKYKGKVQNAHRTVYQILKHDVSADLVLDHLCRNRKCVNPEHLEIVTNAENVMRGEGICAKNSKKTHCKHGHEFTIENTYKTVIGRVCKECLRTRKRAYRLEGRIA